MSEWLSLTTKFPTSINCIGFMNIQESKPENQEKVRNLPLKMKGTEQSVVIKVSKNGKLPGLRQLQMGIGSHCDRFWTFSH